MPTYKMDEYNDVLCPKDVHEILNIGWNKTYNLLNNGSIKSFKIGNVYRIPKECLLDYIRSQTARTAADIHNHKGDTV